ncbi:hypothetical protein ACJJI3_18820 [Microbulbifer sp. ZKSA004]|uniref:hypothetical protein n=1 Tax=Microbulbifer sp. ZKSA004 TaxID=3243389 RepID=UPI004039526F
MARKKKKKNGKSEAKAKIRIRNQRALFKLKNSTVSCPACNLRVPLISIESHYGLNHPGEVFNQQELSSIPFAPETKGKSNPGFGHRRQGAWPLSGGLPSLGKKR